MIRHLQLNQQQETDLVTFLDKRLIELDQDNDDRIKADKCSDKQYENSKKERAQVGTIYAESNLSVPLTCMVVDHFASRTEEEIYGRDPMANFAPEGPADQDTARGLDRFANYKLFKLGKVRDDLLDSNHSGFRHRALVLKSTYFEDIDTWEERNLNVLHSAKDNEPMQILDHGYAIEGRDKFVPGVDPVSQQPVNVLEADPTVVYNQDEHYYAPAPKPIRFKAVNFSGAKSREVDSDCFRAPNDARSLDEADIIAEYYDKPTHWIRDRFIDRTWMKWDQFRDLAVTNATGERKTEDERKKEGNNTKAFDFESASFGIVEIWLERDVLGWAMPQRIVCWYHKKSKTLIDYEFQKKVTPDGRHPYTAIAVAKIKNYWWGLSIPEILDQYQEYCDKQFNRHSFRNSINSNPIIGENPEAIREKKSFLEMKPFEVFTLETGKTVQDWLQAFTFPNADNDTQELIDKALYWVQFWLGISNIARGDYSDVPQNTTLGGQQASLAEASKLSRRWSRRMIKGLQEHLTKLVQIVLATMDPQEAYTYLEGDVTQMGFITEDSVRDLTVNARLIVSKDGSTQKLQEQQLTLQTVTQYMTYPPQIQAVVRPVMKSILFLLGHDDVEQLLPPPMMPMVDPITGQTKMVPVTPNMPVPQTAPTTETQAQPEGQPGGDVVPFSQNQPAPAAPAASNG